MRRKKLKCKIGLHEKQFVETFWKKHEKDKGAAINTYEQKYRKYRCTRCGKTMTKPVTTIANRFDTESPVKRNEETIWKKDSTRPTKQ